MASVTLQTNCILQEKAMLQRQVEKKIKDCKTFHFIWEENSSIAQSQP